MMISYGLCVYDFMLCTFVYSFTMEGGMVGIPWVNRDGVLSDSERES